MKNTVLMAVICCSSLTAKAQESKTANDSLAREITRQECPAELVPYLYDELLKTKAALFVFNESLHLLGRYEFFDAGSMVRYLHIPMRINRCTMLYIDTGLHLFHTMYQQLKVSVYFGQGKIYMARLFSRTMWPLGGVSIIKKNEQGEPEEYAAVLFEYINAGKAGILMNSMRKKEVLVNE